MALVLITGTSRGIGYETALAFARAGNNVLATMRSPISSPQLAEVATKEHLPIEIFSMDVDSDASVTEGFKAIHDKYGPADVLVNNAGIERAGSIEELPLSEFRAVMETNYFGALRCIQAVLPHMRQRRSGCIINVSSVAGRISSSPLTPYMATKWALEALSEGLAGEMKMFNVRVAVVEPGITDTEMAHRLEVAPGSSPYPQHVRVAAIFEASLLKNPVPPADIAKKILEVADSGTWQLRHPVGSGAEGFLQWRKGFTDEEWVALYSADDETWYARIERDFGLDTRPEILKRVAS
jgi:NAD(P)-dependent dehydrogenase (short-subunit alcohol dehydrogenase family)